METATIPDMVEVVASFSAQDSNDTKKMEGEPSKYLQAQYLQYVPGNWEHIVKMKIFNRKIVQNLIKTLKVDVIKRENKTMKVGNVKIGTRKKSKKN